MLCLIGGSWHTVFLATQEGTLDQLENVEESVRVQLEESLRPSQLNKVAIDNPRRGRAR
jgi:hypothetical protein